MASEESHEHLSQEEEGAEDSDSASVDSMQLLADIAEAINSYKEDPDGDFFCAKETGDTEISPHHEEGKIEFQNLDSESAELAVSCDTEESRERPADGNGHGNEKSETDILAGHLNYGSEPEQLVSTSSLDAPLDPEGEPSPYVLKEPIVCLKRLDPNMIPYKVKSVDASSATQHLSPAAELSTGDKKARKKTEIKKSAWYEDDDSLSDISVSVSDTEDMTTEISDLVSASCGSSLKAKEIKHSVLKSSPHKINEKTPSSLVAARGNSAVSSSTGKNSLTQSNKSSPNISRTKKSDPSNKSKDQKAVEKPKTAISQDQRKRNLSRDKNTVEALSHSQGKRQKIDNIKEPNKTIVKPLDNWRFELRLSPIDIGDLGNENFRKYINLASDCVMNFDSGRRNGQSQGQVILYFGCFSSVQSGMQKLGQLPFVSARILHGIMKCFHIKEKSKKDMTMKWTHTEEIKLGFSMCTSWTEKVKQLVQVKDWKRDDETKRKCAQIPSIPPFLSKEMLSLLFPFSINIHTPKSNTDRQKKDSSRNTEIEFENIVWMETILSCFRDFYVVKVGSGQPSWRPLIFNFKPPIEKIPESKVVPPQRNVAARNLHGSKAPAGAPRRSDSFQAKHREPASTTSGKGGDVRKRTFSASQDMAAKSAVSEKKSKTVEDNSDTGLAQLSETSIPVSEAEKCGLESLAQSKGLDPTNTDVLRILEVQNQLMSLQALFSCTPAETDHDSSFASAKSDETSGSTSKENDIAWAEQQLRDNIAMKQQQLLELEQKLQLKKRPQSHASSSADSLDRKDGSASDLIAAINDTPLDFTKPAPKIEEAVKKDEERSKMFASKTPKPPSRPLPKKRHNPKDNKTAAEDFALPLQFGKNVKKATTDKILADKSQNLLKSHVKATPPEPGRGSWSSNKSPQSVSGARIGARGAKVQMMGYGARRSDSDSAFGDGLLPVPTDLLSSETSGITSGGAGSKPPAGNRGMRGKGLLRESPQNTASRGRRGVEFGNPQRGGGAVGRGFGNVMRGDKKESNFQTLERERSEVEKGFGTSQRDLGGAGRGFGISQRGGGVGIGRGFGTSQRGGGVGVGRGSVTSRRDGDEAERGFGTSQIGGVGVGRGFETSQRDEYEVERGFVTSQRDGGGVGRGFGTSQRGGGFGVGRGFVKSQRDGDEAERGFVTSQRDRGGVGRGFVTSQRDGADTRERALPPNREEYDYGEETYGEEIDANFEPQGYQQISSQRARGRGGIGRGFWDARRKELEVESDTWASGSGVSLGRGRIGNQHRGGRIGRGFNDVQREVEVESDFGSSERGEKAGRGFGISQRGTGAGRGFGNSQGEHGLARRGLQGDRYESDSRQREEAGNYYGEGTFYDEAETQLNRSAPGKGERQHNQWEESSFEPQEYQQTSSQRARGRGGIGRGFGDARRKELEVESDSWASGSGVSLGRGRIGNQHRGGKIGRGFSDVQREVEVESDFGSSERGEKAGRGFGISQRGTGVGRGFGNSQGTHGLARRGLQGDRYESDSLQREEAGNYYGEDTFHNEAETQFSRNVPGKGGKQYDQWEESSFEDYGARGYAEEFDEQGEEYGYEAASYEPQRHQQAASVRTRGRGVGNPQRGGAMAGRGFGSVKREVEKERDFGTSQRGMGRGISVSQRGSRGGRGFGAAQRDTGMGRGFAGTGAIERRVETEDRFETSQRGDGYDDMSFETPGRRDGIERGLGVSQRGGNFGRGSNTYQKGGNAGFGAGNSQRAAILGRGSGTPQGGGNLGRGSGTPQGGGNFGRGAGSAQRGGNLGRGSGTPQGGGNLGRGAGSAQRGGNLGRGSGTPQGRGNLGRGFGSAQRGVSSGRGSVTPEMGRNLGRGSGTPQGGGNLVRGNNSGMGSGNQQRGSGNPQRGSRNPQRGSGNPQRGSGNPQRGSGNSQRGSGNSQRGSGNPQRGSGNPQRGFRNSQRGSGNRGTGNPQRGSGNPQMVEGILGRGPATLQMGGDMGQGSGNLQSLNDLKSQAPKNIFWDF